MHVASVYTHCARNLRHKSYQSLNRQHGQCYVGHPPQEAVSGPTSRQEKSLAPAPENISKRRHAQSLEIDLQNAFRMWPLFAPVCAHGPIPLTLHVAHLVTRCLAGCRKQEPQLRTRSGGVVRRSTLKRWGLDIHIELVCSVFGPARLVSEVLKSVQEAVVTPSNYGRPLVLNIIFRSPLGPKIAPQRLGCCEAGPKLPAVPCLQ